MVSSRHLKVFVPTVKTGVEQPSHNSGDRIDSSEIRTFAKIASVARQSQVFHIICPAMLFGNDVFHMMCQFAVSLRQKTVLATIACALPHQLASTRRNHY